MIHREFLWGQRGRFVERVVTKEGWAAGLGRKKRKPACGGQASHSHSKRGAARHGRTGPTRYREPQEHSPFGFAQGGQEWLCHKKATN